MKQFFTFENLPLTLVVLMIVFAWLSALSVIFFA